MTKFLNRFYFVQFERCNAYVELSLLSASLLSSGPDTIFKSPDLLITAVICKEKRYKVKIKRYKVEPRSKEPLYKDVLGTTNDFLYLRYIEVPLSVNFPHLPPPIIIIDHFRVPKTLTFKTRLSAKPFLWEKFHFKENKNHFAFSLALKQRLRATRKWPVGYDSPWPECWLLVLVLYRSWYPVQLFPLNHFQTLNLLQKKGIQRQK